MLYPLFKPEASLEALPSGVARNDNFNNIKCFCMSLQRESAANVCAISHFSEETYEFLLRIQLRMIRYHVNELI